MLGHLLRKLWNSGFVTEETRDKFIWKLVNNKVIFESKNNPEVYEIYNQLSDENIIFQKGEGAELVIKKNSTYTAQAGAISMAKYFMAFRIFLVKKYVKPKSSVLDIGASSGIFLKACKSNGIALNYSKEAVEKMKDANIQCLRGSAEKVPFKDKQFDYTFCFQVIEHLENPTQALRELQRISKDDILVTIPGVKYTRVCGYSSKKRGVHRWHMFEFSKTDFIALLNHLDIKIKETITIRPLDKPCSLYQHIMCYLLRDHPWFIGFHFFRLSKT